MPQPEPFVDVVTVAAFLGQKVSWVYQNTRPLGIPHRKVGPHALRFRLSEVEAWLDQAGDR